MSVCLKKEIRKPHQVGTSSEKQNHFKDRSKTREFYKQTKNCTLNNAHSFTVVKLLIELYVLYCKNNQGESLEIKLAFFNLLKNYK